MKKELKMPKTKFEAIVFTAITAWMVVYVMNYINITVLVKTIKKVYFVEKKSWLLIKNYFMESTSSTDYFYDCYEYERTSSN